MDLINFIPCEIDITSTPFHDTTIITYEIELPLDRKKVVFNLLDDDDFKIPYVVDTTPNSPSGNQLPTQDKKNVCIIYINGEDHITAQGAIDELNLHQNTCGKSKFKISLCRRNSYNRSKNTMCTKIIKMSIA